MITCEVCGKNFEVPQYISADVCGVDCFYAKYWFEIKKAMDSRAGRHAIINGEIYFIGDETRDQYYKGYGGREFTIRFKDGREVTTTNLRHNGSVRDIKDLELRTFFKNNAEFV